MSWLTEYLMQQNKQHQDWSKEDVVLLAVSGGVDSMALLDAFANLPEEVRPQLVVLHVHHHLRREADLDAALVESYCLNRNIPFHIKHWNPIHHPENNIEAAARDFRYLFFQGKMQELSAKLLLTAHHADDQMETILMRLTRGSTLQGYAGIQRKRPFMAGSLLRPLLSIEKRELYAYCASHQVPYREDESNAEDTFTRNRFRNHLVPFLKEENVQATRHFQEFSQELFDLVDIAQPIIQNVFIRCFSQDRDGWKLALDLFNKEKISMQRMVLSFFLIDHWQKEGVSFQKNHVHDLIKLIQSPTPQATLEFSGGVVLKRYEWLFFQTNEKENVQNRNKLDIPVELIQNEWLDLPFNGKIGLFLTMKPEWKTSDPHLSVYRIEETDFQPPFMLRPWRYGDRIQLNSQAPFTKKISRIFIDQKVPQEKRQQACVVVDKTGTIFWVPGFAASRWLKRMTGQAELETKKEQRSYLLAMVEKD